jgi:hypothetical protein
MKNKINKFAFSLIAILAVPSTFAFDADSGIKSALANSKVNATFRARYEAVEQDSKEDASALTLKSRFTVKTGAYNGISAGVEVDNVTSFIDGYNDLTNSYSGDEAVITDPELTDVNQAYLKYSNDNLMVIAGRQRITHNNQRFVGGVAWRQNEQTYDGYRIQYKANDAFSFDYSYLHNINRIFAADSKKADDLRGNFQLVNSSYKVNKQHKFSGYAYVLDFDVAAAMSSSTYGIAYNGKFGAIAVNLALASQSDNGDNPNNFDANYYNIEAATKLGKVKLLAGYEVLGSDNGVGFSTPLATLHKFQGFADNFLGTPGTGIQDMYFSALTKVNGVKFIAAYHDLSSDTGSIDYGTELDLVAAYSFNKSYNLVFKYADYNADDFAKDTSKLWVQLTAKF